MIFTLEELTKSWRRYNSPLIVLNNNDGKVSLDDVLNMREKGDFIHYLIIEKTQKKGKVQ